MTKGKTGGGSIVHTNRMVSAQNTAKGTAKSNNPPAIKPLGTTPPGPPKSPPKSFATPAVAPKVVAPTGAAAKNPINFNTGGKKLGNHY